VPDRLPKLLIAVQLYPDGGGIASIIDGLVELLRDDAEVHMAIIDARAGAVDRLRLPARQLHVLGPRRIANPLLLPGSVIFAVRTARWLRRLVISLKPDALLVQDALDLSTPGLAAVRGTRTKLAVMDHGRLTNVLDPRWQTMIRHRLGRLRGGAFGTMFALDRPWRAARWRLGIYSAHAAWFVGDELSDYFDRAGSRARQYPQLIPSGFGPPTAGQRLQARSDLDVSEDAVLVNMVTRLDAEKNLEAVLPILEEVLHEVGEVQMLIGGDGSLRSWLEDELVERNMGPQVRLLGALTRGEVLRLHHASDFHLYAGVLGCGMSVALLEAMSCGVIPIVSDVPTAQRELVDGAGWVFEAGDSPALAGALRDALKTPADTLAELRSAVVERIASYGERSIKALITELIGSPS
jgi:glycosyltransferase involved in cell wall biosynthesis